MRILVVDHIGSFSLVEGLKAKFGGKHEIATMKTARGLNDWDCLKALDPDAVLCEWGDFNAVELSRHLPPHIPLVVRLHGYESHDYYVNRIRWDRVAKLVTVSPYFEAMMKFKLMQRGYATDVIRIENGVDLKRFVIREDVPVDPRSIAWSGYLNMKKGPALLRCVAESYPTMGIDVAGKFQCENTLRLLTDPPPDNMSFHGWVDPAEFFPGHGWILSTSVTESFSYAVAEGMACGLTPMVYAWPGAGELWPAECIWRSMGDLGKIEFKEPQWCRKWIEDRYSAERQIDEFAALLENL